MALKMKENFQKSQATLALRTGTASSVYINRAGRPVPLIPIAVPSTKDITKDGVTALSKDTEDSESLKGKLFNILRYF